MRSIARSFLSNPRSGAAGSSSLPLCLWAIAIAFGLHVQARAQTGLNGCLYWLDATSQRWTPEEWKEEVGYMQRAGLWHVIIVGPHLRGTGEQPDPMAAAADRFMAACNGTKLRVYFSLWSGPQWYGRWNLEEELSANREVIRELARRYAGHPSFAGWYIPHEIYVVWGDQAEYIRGLYGGLSDLCKQATPDARVIVSPFFILDREGHLGSFRFAEPDEYEAFWHDLLRRTRIDVVALQDSGEHLSFYTLEDRRPYFAAMKRACTRAGKTLWINIETGELHADSYADYESKFGRKTHVNDARTHDHWRVVPPEKLRRKLGLAREFTDTTITWGYREYWDPMRGPAAKERYEAYLAAAIAQGQPATAPAPGAVQSGPRSP